MKRIVSAILALLILFSLTACGGDEWPTNGLGAMLPAPSSGSVKITIDFDNSFCADVKNPSSDEFNKYIQACNDYGFNIESDKDSYSYEAFNSDGYKLKIINYSKSIGIYLDAPIEIGTLRWPNNAIGNALPKPSSNLGKNEWEYDDSFFLYVGNTSLDQFNEYIDSCSEAGFNIDYDRGDKYYHAYNAENYYISLNYEGFHIFSLRAESNVEGDSSIEATSEPTAEPTNAPTEAPTEKATEAPTTAPTQKPTEKKAPQSIPINIPKGFTVLQSYYCNCVESYTLDELEELAQQCGLYTYRYSWSSAYLEMKVSAEPYSEQTDKSDVYLFSGDYIHIVYDTFSREPKMNDATYHFNIERASMYRIVFEPDGMIYNGSEVVPDKYYVIKDGASVSDRYYDAESVMKAAKDESSKF